MRMIRRGLTYLAVRLVLVVVLGWALAFFLAGESADRHARLALMQRGLSALTEVADVLGRLTR